MRALENRIFRQLAYWIIAGIIGLAALVTDATAATQSGSKISTESLGLEKSQYEQTGYPECSSFPDPVVTQTAYSQSSIICRKGRRSSGRYQTYKTIHYCADPNYPHITAYGESSSEGVPVTFPSFYTICSNEAPPPPECSISAGTETPLSVPYLMGQVCYSNCTHTSPKKQICAYLNDGTSSCYAVYTSNGEYCAEEDGSSSRPFDDQLDEDGCYRATANGKKYCQVPDNSPCPNYTIVDGKKYCQTADEGETPIDSDGDGSPDGEDPNPSNPDTDGDGVPDGQDPNPSNPDTDGDGIPDGQDPDNDGNGIPDEEEGEPSQSEYTIGTCSPGTQIQEPECSSDLDSVQCAIYLNNWHHRCEEKQQFEELYGTEQDRAPITSEGESFLDANDPANQLPGSGPGGAGGPNDTNIAFSDAIDMLDDSGFVSGSCPSDISYSVFGETFQFTYQPICQVLSMVNPVIVALGWFAAALIIGRSLIGGS